MILPAKQEGSVKIMQSVADQKQRGEGKINSNRDKQGGSPKGSLKGSLKITQDHREEQTGNIEISNREEQGGSGSGAGRIS